MWIIHTDQRDCQWALAKALGTMSRCYSYPPPGYEKKAYVEPPLSPKGVQKEHHKHKDKKKKRRKDKETNGDSRPHDKDKRLKRNHQSGHVEGMPSLANGVHAEDAPNLVNGNLTRAEAVHVQTKILQASKTKERKPAHDVGDLHRKGLELNGLVDQTPLISVSFQVSTCGNGAAKSDHHVQPPPSIAVLEIENEVNRKRRVEFMPHTEQVWSAVDDQEWLFLRDNQLQIRPKETEKAERASQALANAILLPSVGIYALPFVVLD